MNSTRSPRPSSVAQRDQVVEGVAVAHEHRLHVVAAEVVAQARERAQRVVDAVLRAHHAEVADEVPAAPAQRVVGRAGTKRVRSGALRTTVMRSGATPPRSSATRR